MSLRILRLYAVIVVLLGLRAHAMTFDNRFIPLIDHPFLTVNCKPSHLRADLFITTCGKAFGLSDLDEWGIPELYGMYDERDVALGIAALGLPNPLPSQFQPFDLPWTMEGKIQTQGILFSYRQGFLEHASVGFEWLFMHSNSRQNFFLKKDSALHFTKEEILQLDDIRRQMNAIMGLCGPNANQFGMGDMELYLRYGGCWEYLWKFRTVQAGARLGVFLPTGLVMDINSPASIPFGGNGHYGIYGAADAEFELKEDWKVGFLFQVSKRLARTALRRMPVGKEPLIFGAVVGQARVSPGVTVVFSPYASFENLRAGLGVRIQYTLISHEADSWCDMRADKSVTVNLENVQKNSKWASDYITLNVFYDFGKVKTCRGFDPIVTFAWDIPTSMLVARNSAKTQRVSLGIEWAF